MKRFFPWILAAALAAGLLAPAAAQTHRGTRDEAVALVKKAGAYLQKNGVDKAVAAFNDQHGEFVSGDLYVIMLSMNGDGVALAHGQNAKIVGKNILQMQAGDSYPIKEFYKLAGSPAGHGWFSYKWPNSLTHALEDKHTYVERFGDYLIAVGAYQ